MSTTKGPSERSTIRRLPHRAVYDPTEIANILDEGLVCHVGLIESGFPRLIPMAYVRIDDRLIVHGSAASRLLRALAEGAQACVAVTLVDGLVLARSALHHSMNYRSVVLFGTALVLNTPEEKVSALRCLMERIAPGRWQEVRPPSAEELRQTLVVAIPIHEASAKVRTGPPQDDEADYALPVWAGEVPLQMMASPAKPDPRVLPGVVLPEYLERPLPGWITHTEPGAGR
jgi:nitroimidazol reductase NimA-like FMN-containing flavoprotein (pyridoxamine 5'-phosphate oxidase superfamily)